MKTPRNGDHLFVAIPNEDNLSQTTHVPALVTHVYRSAEMHSDPSSIRIDACLFFRDRLVFLQNIQRGTEVGWYYIGD